MESKFYGVDVSKQTLDIACDGHVVTIENESKSIRRFVRRMGEGSFVAMEATNTYHLNLANACFSAGMRVYVIKPRVTRHYREIMSLHGHTDEMDALAIGSYIEHHHDELRPYTPRAHDAGRLAILIRRRSKLVGAALVCDLKYRQFRRADSFVAYYGLDPKPNDSGKCRGKRRISKRGCRLGRALLYNAAMTAVRSKAWKQIYEKLLAKGLSKIQAIVCIARKLARTAWSIYTHKTTFDPARLCKPLI